MGITPTFDYDSDTQQLVIYIPSLRRYAALATHALDEPTSTSAPTPSTPTFEAKFSEDERLALRREGITDYAQAIEYIRKSGFRSR